MKKVITYIFLFLFVLCFGAYLILANLLPNWLLNVSLIFNCTLIGGFGGIVYCLRAISWDNGGGRRYVLTTRSDGNIRFNKEINNNYRITVNVAL